MIVLGLAMTDVAMRRRLPRSWPWIKDVGAGLCFVAFVIGTFRAMDVLAAWLQAIGWAE